MFSLYSSQNCNVATVQLHFTVPNQNDPIQQHIDFTRARAHNVYNQKGIGAYKRGTVDATRCNVKNVISKINKHSNMFC